MIRFRVSEYPSYQQLPKAYSCDRPKTLIREILSMVSQILVTNWPLAFRQVEPFRKLKNSKREKKLLILGGGPSVNNLSYEQFFRFIRSGGEIFAMNDFGISELAKYIKVNYYFLIDPLYWQEPKTEIEFTKRQRLHHYLQQNPDITIVQPLSFAPFLTNSSTLYINPIRAINFGKFKSPVGLFSHPNYVSLLALAVAKYFDYKEVYFAGLESNTYMFIQVDELNNLSYDTRESHHYSIELYSEFSPKPTDATLPLNTYQLKGGMSSVLYGESIFRRSFAELSLGFINVGGDKFNDMCNRASLIK